MIKEIAAENTPDVIEDEKTVEMTAEDLAGLVNEDVVIGASSILGTREYQQDAFFTYQDREKRFTAAIVCDGMGGLADGEKASGAAVEYLQGKLMENIDNENVRDFLYEAAWETNSIINELTNDDGEPIKAGTTLVMTVIKEGYMHWVSVGDSKIFIIRGGSIFALTHEHNYEFMAELKKNDGNFRYDPNARKDALVSYLGCGRLNYVDVNQKPMLLQNDDIVVLCSDGLYKSLSEEQIRVMFMSEEKDMERAAQMLTTAALMNAKAGQDNTTVVVLKYKNESFLEV